MSELEGLRQLYQATHAHLVIEVAGVTGDLDEAEECVAEGFARAAARWDKLSSYDHPEGWVRRVAVNVARSRWRRARRTVSTLALSRGRQITAGHPLAEEHLDLLDAVHQLRAEQREAIVLHHLLGMPVAEVAAREGVAVGTIKARLSRGRATLARTLAWDQEEADRP